MLLDAVFGTGTVLGPLIAEYTFEKLGWTGFTTVLGLLSVSPTIPIVSFLIMISRMPTYADCTLGEISTPDTKNPLKHARSSNWSLHFVRSWEDSV